VEQTASQLTDATVARTQQPASPLAMLGDIKIAHSVFALPFALLGGVMAARGVPEHTVGGRDLVWSLLLVVIAMVAARTAAMLSNRILDRHIDARNPRTHARPLAAGDVSLRAYARGLVAAVAVFLMCCVIFALLLDNPWPLLLAVPVIAWICAYGLFKRFTWWCHLWLGASLALSVPAAAIAVNPQVVFELPALWVLAAMVLCWVAGFDVIYALQDVDTDVAEGLHSMPSRLGVERAMWCSRTLHMFAAGLLFQAWWLMPALGWWFFFAACIAGTLLVVEHRTVHRWGTTKMALTFFTLNGIVSCVIGAAGMWDLLSGPDAPLG
jgi:4-hydroxybenzoate polyprenyltransferase